MLSEKYIDENEQEVTVLHNGTKEFNDFWLQHCHAKDYSCIFSEEECSYDKDKFAKELGIIRNKECEKSERILSFYYNNHAVKGPITSFFYEKKLYPESYPVYFAIDVLDGYLNNPKYKIYNKEYGARISIQEDFLSNKNLLSNVIDFGLAYSNDKINRAIVTFSHQLICLDEHDQHRWIKHILNQNEYGTNSSFVDFVFGRINNNKRCSIFLAILEEISIINLICDENELPHMFLLEFKDQYENLSGYNVIFQPTKFNLMRFASAMSKILCQHLNSNLFEYQTKELKSVDKILEDEIEKKEIRIQKDFIEWLKINNIINNETEFKKKSKSISKISKLRNIIAHEFDNDEWDEKYWMIQKNIIFDVYDCLREIREGLYTKLNSGIEITYPDSCIVMY